MAQGNEINALVAAWRALQGHDAIEGWRTIHIASSGSCRLAAGRRFPGNEEALLFAFEPFPAARTQSMPRGRGFEVSRVDLGNHPDPHVWIALSRLETGSLELFSKMAGDIVGVLSSLPAGDAEYAFQVFLARVRAWQDFMEREGDGLLYPEAEVGLVGELVVLRSILDEGLAGPIAVQSWQGPLQGLHDFALNTGALEVKSTVSSSSFPAKIGSLDQLDDSLIRPLYLAAVRLSLDGPEGMTLPSLVNELRIKLGAELSALAMFDTRLLHAGFLDSVSERYTRRFTPVQTRFYLVDGTFPRLTAENVRIEIKRARYELDLDAVRAPNIELPGVLKRLGVI